MEKTAPVVLTHYGDASYLRTVLGCLRRSNPDKMVVFLGDETNVKHAAIVGKFIRFSDFAVGPRLKEFKKVFQPIEEQLHKCSKEDGVEKPLSFVFQRWFMLFDFTRFASVERFWTFDTDTLVLAPLSRREDRFAAYDATTQCRDCCLNGFVGSRQLVERYTSCMIDLFSDEAYLAARRKSLEKKVGLAFNEMEVFCEFRRRNKVKTFHAAQPLQGEFFDDALAYDAAYEASPHKIRNDITVKRVWKDGYGALYARHLASGEFVRMVTCNLSWLPDYVGTTLARFCLTPEEDEKVTKPSKSDLLEVDFSQTLADRVRSVLRAKLDVLRGLVGRNSAGAPGTVAQKR